MTDWWDTPQWHAYERECGESPGTRAAMLASAQWQTHVVDLARPSESLWHDVRHSYRGLVRKAEHDQMLSWTTWNGGWSSACEHICRLLHRQSSGRVTRPRETWHMMDRWISAGSGLLRLASREGDPVGYVYFIVHADWAYYASAASLERSVNHALVWSAMLALKERGVRRCELGWQGQATDDKGKRIEFFRRGFGGTTRALTD